MSHIFMARIFVRTVSSCVCTERFSFISLAICGQSLNAGIRKNVVIAVSQDHYVPSTHIMLSTRRNYKTTRELSHLTVEEQFILRVSSKLSQ